MQPFPFFQRGFEERFDDDRSGVVEEDIGGTKVGLDTFNSSDDLLLAGNIRLPEFRGAAGSVYCRNCIGGTSSRKCRLWGQVMCRRMQQFYQLPS